MFVPVLDSNKIRIQRADGYAYHPMEATRDNKSPRALHSAEQLASLPGQGTPDRAAFICGREFRLLPFFVKADHEKPAVFA